MTKLLSVVLTLALMLGIVACGSDDDTGNSGDSREPETIAEASNCTQLMDLFMPIVQDMLDSTSDMTIAEFASVGEDAEFLVDFGNKIDEVVEKSDDLGCEPAELSRLFNERKGSFTAEGPVGEVLLETLHELEFD